MTLQEAISILTIHQQWRKGADIVMIEPKELSQAIDIILDNHLHNQLAEASKMVSDEKGKPLTYWGGVDFTNPNANNIKSNSTFSLTKISDHSWEGCDGCTEQDEAMYKNGYTKGYNAAIAELPKEISDKEIEKESKRLYPGVDRQVDRMLFINGAKWMQEQLKK